MNRTDARKIAKIITNKQLQEMFDNAKEKIKDWSRTSTVNKGLTKGVAWNILTKDFSMDYEYHIMAKINMVREFGDYLPKKLESIKKEKKQYQKPTHQNPIFN